MVPETWFLEVMVSEDLRVARVSEVKVSEAALGSFVHFYPYRFRSGNVGHK